MIIRTEGKERHNYLLNRKKISLLIFALFLIFSSTMVSNLINKTNTQWEWVIKPSLLVLCQDLVQIKMRGSTG